MSTRLLALVFVILALVVLGVVVETYAPANIDAPRLIYLVMALLVASGTGYGFWRFRYDRGAAIAGVLFWAGAIAALMFAYTMFTRS